MNERRATRPFDLDACNWKRAFPGSSSSMFPMELSTCTFPGGAFADRSVISRHAVVSTSRVKSSSRTSMRPGTRSALRSVWVEVYRTGLATFLNRMFTAKPPCAVTTPCASGTMSRPYSTHGDHRRCATAWPHDADGVDGGLSPPGPKRKAPVAGERVPVTRQHCGDNPLTNLSADGGSRTGRAMQGPAGLAHAPPLRWGFTATQ
jgi:hypothetical protein